jgi:hypothetical protein
VKKRKLASAAVRNAAVRNAAVRIVEVDTGGA